ncbi:ArnT family glycosyltransferase [Ktedonobacter racemifer]|uniref:Glycosyl transferase family 39 n=1 Tax=Ktedonobacter racemifer DSM 44963 TaxID=485913 RepID=D6TN17_KTERA|nr:phospholipid carrier-dependent glycosyltransferase [Ktedonobacter racemifer]EFH87167.1 glycosyl transferase family 39 [Ktedonobacter racemifer DSM 44963]
MVRDETQQQASRHIDTPAQSLPTTPWPGIGAEQQLPERPQTHSLPQGRLILHKQENFYVSTVNRRHQRVHPLRKPTGVTSALPKILPQQQTRIADSETRRMPRLDTLNTTRRSRFPIPLWLETLGLLLVLVGIGLAHAYNMFNYPRYELDEGTYIASAWSILQGQLMPYAYGYAHPPAGWIQLATWIPLFNGFFAFGNALNTGRAIVLLYKLGSALLVYLITRRLSARRSLGLLAMVIFALTPLGITYQREIYLDNIAIFWFLLSLFLLVTGNSRLRAIIFSALTLGIAILSKEVLILLMPAMLYAVWLYTTSFQRKFALVAFGYTTLALCSAWILMALMRGEFFSYTWHLPWDNHAHLSLLQTILEQTKRTQSEGSLGTSFSQWMGLDSLLVVISIVAPVFNLVFGFRQRNQLLLSLLALSFWLLFIRGGVVFPYYIIPLIPLVAMNCAFTCATLARWISQVTRLPLLQGILVLLAIAAIVPYDILHAQPIYTHDYAQEQRQAMDWMREHLPRNTVVVIPPQYFVDMRVSGGEAVGAHSPFPKAQLFFNVATDPSIYHDQLKDNWQNIDYILVDPDVILHLNMIREVKGGSSILQQALKHSVERAHFYDISIYQVQHKI